MNIHSCTQLQTDEKGHGNLKMHMSVPEVLNRKSTFKNCKIYNTGIQAMRERNQFQRSNLNCNF